MSTNQAKDPFCKQNCSCNSLLQIFADYYLLLLSCTTSHGMLKDPRTIRCGFWEGMRDHSHKKEEGIPPISVLRL